ncbi:MAG: hypothetical protein OQK04_04180, partial [Kangiellaceae bacterium]|nr:hypothetical protein [Kangiellaceae bacterium]
WNLRIGLIVCLILANAGCSNLNNNGISVEELLKNKIRYSEKPSLKIQGYLLKNESGTSLLDERSDSKDKVTYVHLSIPAAIFNELEQYKKEKVVVSGKFLEHGYIERDGKLRFRPSRIAVSSIFKLSEQSDLEQ